MPVADGGQPVNVDRARPSTSSSSSEASSSRSSSTSRSPSPTFPPRDTSSTRTVLDSDSPFRNAPASTPTRTRFPHGLGGEMGLHASISASPSPYSPTASIALERASETLAGLGLQLTELNMAESDPDIGARCCCNGHDCAASGARRRLDAKLKLCGEIGTALLQRCEALELKYTRAEHQVEVKRRALADSLRHVANLERANTTHLTKYAELSHAFEALEKKYTQSQHSQTLTQQSLTHVRTELARSRASASVQSAAGAGAEERVADAERRFEDARDLLQAETRRLRDQMKWRQMAEERIADLETKLTNSGCELEDIKTARAKDAQDLLANAKARLEALHTELSETFHADAPSEMPEYQRTLEDLVATNALLKHDTSELAINLAEKMEENRQLREELEEVRARPTPQSRPLSVELRPLITANNSHTRTGSNPVVGSEVMRPMHARVASAAIPRSHRRQSSLAPSFTSTSTTEGPSVASPSPGDQSNGSPIVRADSNSNPISPEQRRSSRGSFSGGIPYTINGIVKSKRPSGTRTISNPSRRSVQLHALSDLVEGDAAEGEPDRDAYAYADRSAELSADMGSTTDDPDTDSQSEVSRRKRASVLLPTTMSPKTYYESSPMTDSGAFEPPSQYPFPDVRDKRIGRRTLLLLSRSTGVQTDPLPIPEPIAETPEPPNIDSPGHVYTPIESPETSSLQHSRNGSRVVSQGASTPAAHTMGELVDFLSKILVKLHGVEVRTLNGRLKKHNLPGDVGHVSRTTIAALRAEVTEMRHKFRHVLEPSSTTRRDMTLLLKLLKDVFTDLLELQGLVNDVTVNPKLAKQLRAKAFADDAAPPPSAGPLGWIAAPLANWLIPPIPTSGNPPVSPTAHRRTLPSQAAPKLQASTSATTTTVSVEFGGAGSMVRRAAPATPKKTRVTAVVGGADVFGDPARSVSGPVSGSEPAPLSPRRHASLAAPGRRSDLMGIFAGGASLSASAMRDASPSTRMRHASSQYFGSRPVRSAAPRDRADRLSTIVDAVLDPDPIPEDIEPALTRALRPRGLSDSSIRSAVIVPSPNPGHFDTEPVPVPSYIPTSAAARYSVGTVAALAESLGSGLGSFTSLGSLGRRIYAVRDGTGAVVDSPSGLGGGEHAEAKDLPVDKESDPVSPDADTDAEADAEAEFEATPRPRRVRPRSSADMLSRKKRSTDTLTKREPRERVSRERLAPARNENLAPPAGATTPTPSSPLRAPRTPSRPALAPSLAIPATVAAATGTSPSDGGGAGGLLERLAGEDKDAAAPGLRSLSLRGSVRVAGRKWR